jgi:hypothetical protein
MVIDLSVASLVSSNRKDEVAHLCALSQGVVLNGFLWCVHALPVFQTPLVQTLEHYCVSVDSFLLEIANESVT